MRVPSFFFFSVCEIWLRVYVVIYKSIRNDVPELGMEPPLTVWLQKKTIVCVSGGLFGRPELWRNQPLTVGIVPVHFYALLLIQTLFQ